MRWRFWRREYSGNGEVAEKAREEAEDKLRDTRRQWPEVREAHDRLSEWIDSALRGQQT
jgi:hypothetical protein